MIRSYFQVLHNIIEKIIRGNTQPANDVLGTSPEGPVEILTSRTYRGPSGDLQGTNAKIDGFMKQLFFRSNSPYRKNKYSKVLNREVHGTSTGRLRDPVVGRPWDQMMRGSRDIPSVKHVF